MHLTCVLESNSTNEEFGSTLSVTPQDFAEAINIPIRLNSPIPTGKNSTMFKKFSLTDKLLFVAAFLSLLFAEIIFFQGHKLNAIFVGLWVPSILGFGIYLKLIARDKNE